MCGLAHVNHGLRGAESDADERFVRRLAEVLDWEYAGTRLRIGEGDAIDEASLRDLRFEALEGMMASGGGEFLYLGHHQDDVAETMLIGLARGNGLAGLASPRPCQVVNVAGCGHEDIGSSTRRSRRYTRAHPLLAFRRREIEAVLRQAAIPWREDRSNQSSRYLRNRLRLELLPLWREIAGRDLTRGMAASRAALEDADSALDAVVDRLVADWDSSCAWGGQDLVSWPTEVCRRALLRWLHRHAPVGEVSGRSLDPFLSDWRAGRRAVLQKGNVRVVALDYGLSLEGLSETAVPVFSDVRWNLQSRLYWPDGSHLLAETVAPDDARELIREGKVDPDHEVLLSGLPPDPVLSAGLWREGERIRMLGSPGKRKLQDVFTDRRIPAALRRVLPVIRMPETDEVLWVPGLPPAEVAKVDGRSKVVWRIAFRTC